MENGRIGRGLSLDFGDAGCRAVAGAAGWRGHITNNFSMNEDNEDGLRMDGAAAARVAGSMCPTCRLENHDPEFVSIVRRPVRLHLAPARSIFPFHSTIICVSCGPLEQRRVFSN